MSGSLTLTGQARGHLACSGHNIDRLSLSTVYLPPVSTGVPGSVASGICCFQFSDWAAGGGRREERGEGGERRGGGGEGGWERRGGGGGEGGEGGRREEGGRGRESGREGKRQP